MPKITPRKKGSTRETVTVSTRMGKDPIGVAEWWKANNREERNRLMLESASFLKEQQQYRYRQAGIFSRLYSNIPLYGYGGTNLSRLNELRQLPIDRPTMNVVQSCVDTLISRITQSKPRPVFLTDNGDYRQRNLAKQLNGFIQGELFQTKAYELGETLLLDAAVLGTGCWKVYETQNRRVGVERTLLTELLVDENDSWMGYPRQLYQFQLIDRQVLAETFPKYRSDIAKAEQAYPDSGSRSGKTISDQVMVVEAWHLPSHPDATDGSHMIGCTNGCLLDEGYDKEGFPFVFLNYSRRITGFWGQPLTEQLMGTQNEINKLLQTITASINMVGVPRVFVEKGSKVVSAHLNNQVGAIIHYSGTPPSYQVAPCIPQEVYGQLQRLVDYAYQQSGISALAASSQKPQGIDSGTALREYDDLQSDRFASLVKRYDHAFIDLAYLIVDKAKDIAERDGKYQTVWPNKNGTKEVDLPAAKILDNPFVIQAFDSSSLPRDPAGRMQQVVEMIQSGMISLSEGRRLIDYPDLEQVNKLATASEERILKCLDDIVETGKYTPPDPFMDLQLADELTTQYYNLYAAANLEASKEEKIRTFSVQVKTLKTAAMPPPMPMNPPQANAQPLPTSPLVPNGNPIPGMA